ncbi:MAG: PilZ domain-containing protein [Nitrospiraceae bacterium]
MDARKSPRFAVQLPVSFNGDGGAGKGTVFNLSMDGCRIGSDDAVKPNSYLELHIEIPNCAVPMTIELAAVRWSDGQQFGLEFIRVNAEAQERLRTLVRSLDPAARP